MVFKSTHCQNSIIIDWTNENTKKFNKLVWNTDLNKEIENYSLTWGVIKSPASSKNLMTNNYYYFNLDNGIPNYYFQIEYFGIDFWQINSNGNTLIINEGKKIESKYNLK